MRFLLTNDDGIYAKGLSSLYEELSHDAECLIVAPEIEQSAVGHAITLFRPLMVRSATKGGNFLGYAVCGTPADCVKIGIKELASQMAAMVRFRNILVHDYLEIDARIVYSNLAEDLKDFDEYARQIAARFLEQ